ncbi:MAG: hypothetical protein QNJ98_03220 [Planctomycetota bacterium]|nr:hypothetical protein [Planctomycetota bacterium]
MSNWRFVELWCAGYGALWAILLLFAFLSQSHIDTGMFGLIGFPILALLYAAARWPHVSGSAGAPSRVDMLEREVFELRRRLERDQPRY